MLVISVRGVLLRTELGRRLTAEEIRGALDGAKGWRRVGRPILVDGAQYVCLEDFRAGSKYLGRVNKLASEVVGETVRGPAAFLILGVEI